VPQDFYRRNKDKNVHQPLCIDYPNVTSGIRELSAKTYIKWINMIPHCHHEYSYARHISSALKSIKVFNPIKRNLKGKTQFTTRYRGGNTIWSDYINKARDTSRSWHLKNTREREIKHIATGTNPQPRGWTTPSSSWWLPGWWRWPPEMIPPSGRVPEQGLDWFSVATEPCGGETSGLG